MHRKSIGLLIVLMALVLTGCPNSNTDTPEPGSTTDAAVTLLAIPGVTAPVSGETPVTTAINTPQYTGTIAWSPADSPFAASTVYTASIVLKAKAGYTLTGVAANGFTVAGATATNALDSGTVTAVFPKTADTPAPDAAVTLLAIPGVTAPVSGETPVTTAIDTAQYTGTIEWSPAHSPFEASTVYTASIVLTAKAGYTLTGVAADSFTVAGATATNALDSGAVIAVFPATLSFSLTMVSVPAGTFQRDATAANKSTVSAFRMSAYEITRAQFLAVMGTDPSDAVHSSGDTDPVHNVNWYHAIAFCNKLSIAEGLTPVYTVDGVDFATLTYADVPTGIIPSWWSDVTANFANDGYRLPTEMEWMWAAMGATGTGTNTTGYKMGYAGSTEAAGSQVNIGNYAWYGGNVSDSKTRPVGTRTANVLGLFDMNGNVGEWCWDWYKDSYPTGANTNYWETTPTPQAPNNNKCRVARGGSWVSPAGSCTVAYRGVYYPEDPTPYYGIRVVRR